MITIDFETRSAADLRRCGASVYARHSSTEVLCLAWYEPGSGISLWTPGQSCPEPLKDAIVWGELFEAHNVFFERNIWHHVCHRRMGWPDIPAEQWRCSMAACCRLALPRSLDSAGEALGLSVRKDREGHKVMLKLSRPGKPQASLFGDLHEKLYEYCKQDVRTEVAISQAVEPMPHPELQLWQLDQQINLRGLAIDVTAVRHAIAVVEQTYQAACREIELLTEGRVSSPKQVAAILAWIKDRTGETLPDLTKDSVDGYLASPGHECTAQILEIRSKAAGSSTSKLQAMLARCDDDGRVRGNLVYHGAATGRWSGSGIQIQNFTRGNLSQTEIELVHQLLSRRSARAIDLTIGDPIKCISGCLRSMVRAGRGNRLLIGDFASFEARVLAWIAGQDDLLAQFSAGADVYVSMASRIYSVPPEDVTKQQRHVGKTAVLGLGYSMGHRAFRDACKTMAGVEVSLGFAKGVVRTYRAVNDRIRNFWGELSSAAIRAVQTKKPHRVGRLEIDASDKWLRIKLPSGRRLHYREPHLVSVLASWSVGYCGMIFGGPEIESQLESLGVKLGEREPSGWRDCDVPTDVKKRLDQAGIAHDLEKKEPQYVDQIQYWGVKSQSRKWGRIRTYGGKLCENVVQAIARDFLAEAMFRCERGGYPIVATVHDEIISERKVGEGSLEEFEGLMRQVPRWGEGCPISVEGFESERYRK